MDKCTLLFVFVCSLLRLVVWSRVKLVETQGWSKRVVVKVRGHEEGESIKLFSSAFTIKTPDSVGEGFRSKTTRKDEERQRHRKAAEKVTISWGAPPSPPPSPAGGLSLAESLLNGYIDAAPWLSKKNSLCCSAQSVAHSHFVCSNMEPVQKKVVRCSRRRVSVTVCLQAEKSWTKEYDIRKKTIEKCRLEINRSYCNTSTFYMSVVLRVQRSFNSKVRRIEISVILRPSQCVIIISFIFRVSLRPPHPFARLVLSKSSTPFHGRLSFIARNTIRYDTLLDVDFTLS